MATDDLKSFKIGDKVKKPVEPPKAGARAEPAPEAASVGFPRIEAVVEQEQVDLSGLQARQAELSAMAAQGKSNKDKAAAKRAALAYQRAQELIAYLLETKARMTSGSPPTPSG